MLSICRYSALFLAVLSTIYSDPLDHYWQQKVDWYFHDGLKIGNHQQNGVFHYTEKDFCDKILARYEQCTG